jgi:hypothetical protein
MNATNNNPVRKMIMWICILLVLLALPALACDEGGGCDRRDPVTGVCVDSSASNPNAVSEGAKDFLCKNQTNPDYDDFCK